MRGETPPTVPKLRGGSKKTVASGEAKTHHFAANDLVQWQGVFDGIYSVYGGRLREKTMISSDKWWVENVLDRDSGRPVENVDVVSEGGLRLVEVEETVLAPIRVVQVGDRVWFKEAGIVISGRAAERIVQRRGLDSGSSADEGAVDLASGHNGETVPMSSGNSSQQTVLVSNSSNSFCNVQESSASANDLSPLTAADESETPPRHTDVPAGSPGSAPSAAAESGQHELPGSGLISFRVTELINRDTGVEIADTFILPELKLRKFDKIQPGDEVEWRGVDDGLFYQGRAGEVRTFEGVGGVVWEGFVMEDVCQVRSAGAAGVAAQEVVGPAVAPIEKGAGPIVVSGYALFKR